MRLLLDTQILLWSLYQPTRIPAATQARIVAPANDVLFSAVSIAEIGIKFSLGREDFPFHPEEVMEAAVTTGLGELRFCARHAARLASLPWLHHDPFDRMLVAQTMEEGLRFLTADRALNGYTELVLPMHG